jgi:hypothetical protein
MADGELVDMASQFKGLPMADLIGGPLRAACDAQIALANATATFIKVVGFMPPSPAQIANQGDSALGDIRTAKFSFERAGVDPLTNTATSETVVLNVPLLAVVKIPSLFIDTVDITFDMEVKSSASSKESEDKAGKFSADAHVGWGCFSMNVHVEGSVATHKENTRSSDNSAKYHVEVHASDKGMPEGLSRVLDMMNAALVPRVATVTAAPLVGQLSLTAEQKSATVALDLANIKAKTDADKANADAAAAAAAAAKAKST